MKKLFVLLLVFPFFSYAQTDGCYATSFTSLSGSFNFPKGLYGAMGGKLGYNVPLSPNGVYLGGSIEAVRFSKTSSWYLPLALNLTYIHPPTGKVSPALTLAPGYGYYNHDITKDAKTYSSQGGFTFYGGGGVVVGAHMFTAGYSLYTYSEGGKQERAGGFGFRMGVMF